jgi:hypothetical protein
MAILLKEKGKYTVLSAPTIQSELGSTFQITGMLHAEKPPNWRCCCARARCRRRWNSSKNA